MTGSGVNQLSPRRDRPPWCDFRASTNAALARYEWQPTNQQRDWVMQRTMLRGALYSALLIGLTAALGACGGGGSGSTLTPTPMSGTMPLTISDASSDDWATIGVKLLSIAFV